MTDRFKVLILCPAGVAALLCAVTQQRKSTAVLSDIRNCAKENVAETRALHRTLCHQRGAINDIHSYLVPVTKGSSKKLPKANNINGRIFRSGRVKRGTFRHG